MSPGAWFELIASGLITGGIYALIALGYTMVYGILRFINFAHSDVFALGTHMTIVMAAVLGVKATEGIVGTPRYMAPEQQREAARGMLLDKKVEESLQTWTQDVRAQAYVEFREPPRP